MPFRTITRTHASLDVPQDYREAVEALLGERRAANLRRSYNTYDG